VTHRTLRNARCAPCERTYTKDLALKKHRLRGKDGDQVLDAILQVAGLVVATLVLVKLHWGFLPLGFYVTALFFDRHRESHKRLDRRERKRFLAEDFD
jgi:hypothetical protein